ncbi:MAG: hypothetical protein M1825_000740 [Sarcosagium campestre]|nr:MAG: hypothetical protein M1825_000740 [Sarcosagium campestre]
MDLPRPRSDGTWFIPPDSALIPRYVKRRHSIQGCAEHDQRSEGEKPFSFAVVEAELIKSKTHHRLLKKMKHPNPKIKKLTLADIQRAVGYRPSYERKTDASKKIGPEAEDYDCDVDTQFPFDEDDDDF